MDLIAYYRQQHQWRHWSRIYEALPGIDGRSIVDLGCGIGDQTADLVARGASLTGIDANEGVIEAALRNAA